MQGALVARRVDRGRRQFQFFDPETGDGKWNDKTHTYGCGRVNCSFVHPGSRDWNDAPTSFIYRGGGPGGYKGKKRPRSPSPYGPRSRSPRRTSSPPSPLSKPTPSPSGARAARADPPPSGGTKQITPTRRSEPPEFSAYSDHPKPDPALDDPQPMSVSTTSPVQESIEQRWANRIKGLADAVRALMDLQRLRTQDEKEQKIFQIYSGPDYQNSRAQESIRLSKEKLEQEIESLKKFLDESVKKLIRDPGTGLFLPGDTKSLGTTNIQELEAWVAELQSSLNQVISVTVPELESAQDKIKHLETELQRVVDILGSHSPSKRQRSGAGSDNGMDDDDPQERTFSSLATRLEELESSHNELSEEYREMEASVKQHRRMEEEGREEMRVKRESELWNEKQDKDLKERFDKMEGSFNTAADDLLRLQETVTGHDLDWEKANDIFNQCIENINELDSSRTTQQSDIDRLTAENTELKIIAEDMKAKLNELEEKLVKSQETVGNQSEEIRALGDVISAHTNNMQQPNLEQFFTAAQERLRTEISQLMLGDLLRQQKESIIQSLMPKLNPTFIMVEEIYAFMKKVESAQSQLKDGGVTQPSVSAKPQALRPTIPQEVHQPATVAALPPSPPPPLSAPVQQIRP